NQRTVSALFLQTIMVITPTEHRRKARFCTAQCLSGHTHQTDLDYPTCMGMCLNGVMIGTLGITISRAQERTHLGQHRGIGASFVVVPGLTTATCVGVPFAARNPLRSPPTMLGSA